MDSELIAGIIGIVVLAVWIRAAGNPFMFAAIFRSPLALGWPRGVQEDDDLRWRWRRGEPRDAGGPDGGEDADALVIPMTPVTRG